LLYRGQVITGGSGSTISTGIAGHKFFVIEEQLARYVNAVAAHFLRFPFERLSLAWISGKGARSPLALPLAVTVFSSAFLLFCLEPMVGKMVLPLLGGAPAVWNTCLAFFQVALVVGYAYAHGTLAWLGARRQALLHLCIVAAPLLALPVRVAASDVAGWPAGPSPSWRLLGLLAVKIGLPFVALATTAPIVQTWFSHSTRKEPYFLYAASNVGSLLGLFAYPVVWERVFGLKNQARFWAWGYAGFVGLVICSSVWVARAGPPPGPAPANGRAAGAPISARRRARWVLLSAVPSALLVSVTTYLSSEVAAVPLLWAVPLALYLGTFIVAFSTRPLVSVARSSRVLPLPVAAAFLMLCSEAGVPVWALFLIHAGMFSLAAMMCHGELAEERPAAIHLTDYFLCISLGGALGGMAAALVAPVLFRSVLEYPIEIVAVCLLRKPGAGVATEGTRNDVLWAVGIGALTLLLASCARRLGLPPTPSVWVAVGVPVLLHYGTLARPLRFALGLGSIFAASQLSPSPYGRALRTERSFFGVLRVTTDPTGRFRQIVHGATVHGRQAVHPARRREPSLYYARSGPIGEVLTNIAPAARRAHARSVGVIGLGCGVLAAYARPGERWTFFEIDPKVERVARDPSLFSFLTEAFPSNRDLEVVLGDARLKLGEFPKGAFDLLILDAFSSDVVPAHLLVREAMMLYLEKLSPEGMLAMHVSNHYFELEPVVAAVTQSVGLSAKCWADTEQTADDEAIGKVPSKWCIAARSSERLGALNAMPKWRPARANGARPWTDDRADVLGALRLFGGL
jgi:hypothetical protein